MTWKSFHRRGEVLRQVTKTADARRDGILPMDVAGVTETFGDERSLLGALQLRWHTRLSGRIERELMTQPMDLEAAVVAAWRATASEMPGVRAILDRYRDHPTDAEMARMMTKAAAKEHELLAVMAGQGGVQDSRSVRLGEQIAERARRGSVPVTGSAGRHAAEPTSLVDRIKAALAA